MAITAQTAAIPDADLEAPAATLTDAPAGAANAGLSEPDTQAMEQMVTQAQAAAAFLKALAHEGRLLILCHLSTGEKSVTELENLLGSRQAAVSQQLARLRLEGLVSCRREGKAIYYSLGDPRAAQTIGLMYEMFCGPSVEPSTEADSPT
ncbi:ArsR/SmtB family transcription factor [Pararhodobacter oceanensis]